MFSKFFARSDNTNDENTNPQTPEENAATKRVAAIKYGVDASGEMHIDVDVEDFSRETIDHLSKILITLSMDNCYLETIQMIQTSLQQYDQEDALMQIYAAIAANPNDKAVRIHNEKVKSKPCIRPSDML